MPLPVQTPEQRAAALVAARAALRERADMIAAVKAGTLTLAQVLERTDPVARKTRIGQVLRALPGYGPVRVTSICTELSIDPDKRLGSLGEAQRARLLESVA